MEIRFFPVAGLSALLALTTVAPAMAASSAWHDATGGRVRLVTSGPVDAHGVLRGALQIDLKPGWKTYWRDPGASGVPPQIDLVGGEWTRAEIAFPAPQLHKDDYGSWAGYDYSVALPVNFTAQAGKQPTALEASTFLGICETICVPLQAQLSLTIDQAATPAEDSAIVEAAWAALPEAASAEFGVTGVEPDGADTVAISVVAPGGASQLFVAGQDGYSLAVPQAKGDGRFSLKILTRPAQKPDGEGLPYTLVAPGGTVSGYIAYP